MDYRTFFRTTHTWPMHDNADPLNGWSSKEVEECSSGPAAADIYGKLFYHIRAVLRAFVLRLSDLQVTFRLFQMDASQLPDHLERGSFSRIEVRRSSLHLPSSVCYQISKPLRIGLQYFGRGVSWGTPHSFFDGASASRASHQPPCDSHHSFHERCGREHDRPRPNDPGGA